LNIFYFKKVYKIHTVKVPAEAQVVVDVVADAGSQFFIYIHLNPQMFPFFLILMEIFFTHIPNLKISETTDTNGSAKLMRTPSSKLAEKHTNIYFGKERKTQSMISPKASLLKAARQLNFLKRN